MSQYENVLLGKKLFSLDWTSAINSIKKENVIICDFSKFEKVKKIIKEKNIKYIIPLSNQDYQTIKNYDLDIKILYPTEEISELLNNKNIFTDYMLKKYPKYIPEIYYLDNIKLKEIEYPAISKPIYSTNGTNIVIIHNEEDFAKINNKNNIQKFVDNLYEYSAYMLCIDGAIINQKIIRFRYEKYYIKKGNFARNHEKVVNLDTSIFEKIIYDLNCSGGICIDFKVDDNNNLYIFEINPRFGGSAFWNNFIYELLCIKN